MFLQILKNSNFCFTRKLGFYEEQKKVIKSMGRNDEIKGGKNELFSRRI